MSVAAVLSGSQTCSFMPFNNAFIVPPQAKPCRPLYLKCRPRFHRKNSQRRRPWGVFFCILRYPVVCQFSKHEGERMAHAPKFLSIVNDAKKRVKETNV